MSMKLVKKWQKILRLQDWDIGFETCTHADFNYEKVGHIGWNRPHKTAKIVILNNQEIKKLNKRVDQYRDVNAEGLILHELLHLKLMEIVPDESVTEEQVINQLVVAFLDLDRRN